ncbi:hypothetical protein AJ80_00158 [Polytolypa hystricis UAMH7299]|uniref:FAD/NAD(P)-binding domain-containing protein n=1 Tax=Polytolypa hystricis (strain UAMH7299) TaxID=1447883 RepID=A0A2B7Z5Z4_POLH7|nr:hypothetical protein AJ80_00158 [Polytolypa hystricis UAMH7299]
MTCTETLQASISGTLTEPASSKSMTVNVESISPVPMENGINVEPITATKRQNGERGYYRNEELGGPIHTERHMRIIVCGAGASGLCFAYKLQRSFKNFSLNVFEKNPDISGTWYENRYPGCACDVPSHTYTFSWEPKTDWSAVYAGSAEIKGYFRNFASKNNLWPFISVNHQVEHAQWDDTAGEWTIRVRNTETGEVSHHVCDIFINGSGILNNWQWPQVEGLDVFKGKLLHSANYETDFDLTGKKIGLIGNGSSGIQILPAIQPLADSVKTFIRSSTWVTPLRGFEQHLYTDEEKDEFKHKSGALLDWRKNAESNVNKIFPMFLSGSKLQEATKKAVTKQMRNKLLRPDLQEQLIPKWDFGCRRMTPGVGYLDALQKENVEVVIGEVDRVTEDGCLVGRDEYKLDVLICATGFNVSFRPRFPIIGHKENNLQDIWQDAAHSYLGLAAPEQPNYLHFLGPNCPIGSGPLVGAIEAQADYMLHWCDRWQTEKIHSFSPKKDAIADFVARTDLFMRDTIWASGCRSWYKSHTVNGRVSALWPGSSLHYFEALRHPRAEDWDIVYRGNRFDWLGNGFSQTECDLTADWAYYIRDEDDSPFLSKAKQREILTKSGTVEPEEEEDGIDGEDDEWKAWC